MRHFSRLALPSLLVGLFALVAFAADSPEEDLPPKAGDAPQPAPAPDTKTMTHQKRVRAFGELNLKLVTVIEARNFEEAANLSRRMIDLLPDRPEGYYNLACAHARLGKTDETFASLSKALDHGFSNPDHMKMDTDLESVRADVRFEAALARARENLDAGVRFAYDKPIPIPGVKTVENVVRGGLRYRLRMDPNATGDKPNRVIVWLHPSGGYGNNRVEAQARMFIKHGYALLVFTRKNARSWSSDEFPRILKSLEDVAKVEGIDARRPILFGFSAGGQAALHLWSQNPGNYSGLVLDAAYPIDPQSRARGRITAMPIPAGPSVKNCPMFIIIGEKDGGLRLWNRLIPKWTAAGIPIELHTVPNQGHRWLFNVARWADLDKWLTTINTPKTAPVPAEDQFY